MKDRIIGVAVCGAAGRMGRKVVQAVLERPDMRLAGALERPDCPLLGRDLAAALGEGAPADLRLTADFAEGTKNADIYIDFTSVSASLAHLALAVDKRLPAVIGVTGFSAADQALLRGAGRAIPLLWAPNMSVGVAAMYRAAAELARSLGPTYDMEIMEIHHRRKEDAPSGTALKLAQTAALARGLDLDKSLVSGRQGRIGPRKDEEIGVLALRGGDVVGDHTVYFLGPGERLELTHRAHTRDTFAQGAARAAAWLAAGRAPGLYSLEDALK